MVTVLCLLCGYFYYVRPLKDTFSVLSLVFNNRRVNSLLLVDIIQFCYVSVLVNIDQGPSFTQTSAHSLLEFVSSFFSVLEIFLNPSPCLALSSIAPFGGVCLVLKPW